MGNFINNLYNSDKIISDYQFIIQNNHPKSLYYQNTYLREWIKKHKIYMNYHQWTPLGTNYTVNYYYYNTKFIGDVSTILSCFIKTNLSIQYHLEFINFIDENCYILLSHKQQQLLKLNEEPYYIYETINQIIY